MFDGSWWSTDDGGGRRNDNDDNDRKNKNKSKNTKSQNYERFGLQQSNRDVEKMMMEDDENNTPYHRSGGDHHSTSHGSDKDKEPLCRNNKNNNGSSSSSSSSNNSRHNPNNNRNDGSFRSSLYDDDDDDDDMMDPNRLSNDTGPTLPAFDDIYDDIAKFDDHDHGHDVGMGNTNYYPHDDICHGGHGSGKHRSRSSGSSSGHSRHKKLSFSKTKGVGGSRSVGSGGGGVVGVVGASRSTSTRTGSSNNSRGTTPSHNSAQLRQVSLKELIATLGSGKDMSTLHPTLERRVRDFRFAQRKRREKYGPQKRWGVFGLYQHLADMRLDLEWAEDAAWRRNHCEPYYRWTDYENSRSKGFNRPFFTYLTILISSGMMICTIGMNGWTVEPLTINPLIGPSAQVLIQAGARETSLIVNGNQWFRLFSPLILHAGCIHFVINMMALYFIGAAVEQCHGFVSSAVLFIVPAVGGNILSAIFLPQYISVGASGGIFGLIGACIADIVINWNLLFIKADEDGVGTRLKHAGALLWLVVDIILNCLIGLTPFVDNFTHLGGLFYGICCGLSTLERVGVGFFGVVSTGKHAKLRNDLLRFCGLIFSVILIMVTTALLIDSDGTTSPCHSCRYVSCVPFPFWVQNHNKWWNCDDCDFAVADLVKISGSNLYYDRIDLTCPDGDISIIDITDEQQSDREVIRRKLPSYCRKYCDDVYITN